MRPQSSPVFPQSRPLLRLCGALAGTLLAAFCPSGARGADWPAFRGPHATGHAEEALIPKSPAIRWSAKLPGRGLSSPILAGGKLFVTSASGAEQEKLQLHCFDAESGKCLWTRQLLATGRTMTHPKTSVAANTPCTDGRRVYALWSCNDLAAFDLEGNLLWLRGLTADYSNASNSLGMASSLLVVGNTLVVPIENDSESYALGVDPASGRNLWKLERPKAANWTTPVALPIKASGPRGVLLQSAKGVLAVDVANGKTLWEFGPSASSMSSSIVDNGVAYVPAAGITALELPVEGREPVTKWNSRQINPATVSPLLLKGRIYSLNSGGILTAAEATSGDVKWKLRVSGPFSGSPVGAGERIALVSEKGLLQIVDTTAPEGAVLAQLQLPLEEQTKELVLCTPALSGQRVFVRTDSTLWCVGE